MEQNSRVLQSFSFCAGGTGEAFLCSLTGVRSLVPQCFQLSFARHVPMLMRLKVDPLQKNEANVFERSDTSKPGEHPPARKSRSPASRCCPPACALSPVLRMRVGTVRRRRRAGLARGPAHWDAPQPPPGAGTRGCSWGERGLPVTRHRAPSSATWAA